MIEITNYFCINENCKSYGLRNEKNIVKAGKYITSTKEKKQMLKCNICNKRFSETQKSIFFRSHYSSETINKIISCTVEGNGVRSTSRILNLSKDGVNKVILKAGNHAQKVLSDLLHSLNMNECQLDELWSFVQKKRLFPKKI
jgi:transposase-like protein